MTNSAIDSINENVRVIKDILLNNFPQRAKGYTKVRVSLTQAELIEKYTASKRYWATLGIVI